MKGSTAHGHPQPWVLLLISLGLLPWLLPVRSSLKLLGCPLLVLAVALQLMQQLGDEVIALHRYGQQWLLARHRGRAALVTTAAAQRSCLLARRLAVAHGHQTLDWVVLLDSRPTDALPCWRSLAHYVQLPHQGQTGLSPGQRLASSGLELKVLTARGRSLSLDVGSQRWWLFPSPQVLWGFERTALRHQSLRGIWLGYCFATQQLRDLYLRFPSYLWVATTEPGHFTTRRAGI